MREVDAAEFRHLCGHFATGVVILTAVDGAAQPAGMTANSFTSVSLVPPLVSINVDHAADMHAIMLGTERWSINVLESAQEPLSRRFAGNTTGRFDGVGYEIGPPGHLTLDGVLAVIHCRAENLFAAGDHTVFVGRVTGGVVRPGRPLLYYRGGYMMPGPP